MIRTLGLATACLIIAVNATESQESAPPSDTLSHEVTDVSIKSGKLALSSAANPGSVFLADGAYKNDSDTFIIVVDGRIIRIEYGTGTVSQVATIRLQRDDRVMLTPPVTALMQVTPFPLPSGTFRSQHGALLKVSSGRPVEFTLPPR